MQGEKASCRLSVSGLPPQATESGLLKMMSEFRPRSVKLQFERLSAACLGHGLVEFFTPADAAAARNKFDQSVLILIDLLIVRIVVPGTESLSPVCWSQSSPDPWNLCNASAIKLPWPVTSRDQTQALWSSLCRVRLEKDGESETLGASAHAWESAWRVGIEETRTWDLWKVSKWTSDSCWCRV